MLSAVAVNWKFSFFLHTFACFFCVFSFGTLLHMSRKSEKRKISLMALLANINLLVANRISPDFNDCFNECFLMRNGRIRRRGKSKFLVFSRVFVISFLFCVLFCASRWRYLKLIKLAFQMSQL